MRPIVKSTCITLILFLYVRCLIGQSKHQDKIIVGLSVGVERVSSEELDNTYNFPNVGLVFSKEVFNNIEVDLSFVYSRRKYSEFEDSLRTARDLMKGTRSEYFSESSESVVAFDNNIKYAFFNGSIKWLFGVGHSLMIPISIVADRKIVASDGFVMQLDSAEFFRKSIYGLNLMIEGRYEVGPKLSTSFSLLLKRYFKTNYGLYGFPDADTANFSVYPRISIFYKL